MNSELFLKLRLRKLSLKRTTPTIDNEKPRAQSPSSNLKKKPFPWIAHLNSSILFSFSSYSSRNITRKINCETNLFDCRVQKNDSVEFRAQTAWFLSRNMLDEGSLWMGYSQDCLSSTHRSTLSSRRSVRNNLFTVHTTRWKKFLIIGCEGCWARIGFVWIIIVSLYSSSMMELFVIFICISHVRVCVSCTPLTLQPFSLLDDVLMKHFLWI